MMNESYKTDYLMHIKNAGMLWYIVDPFESAFESVAEVPDYQYQVILLNKLKLLLISINFISYLLSILSVD